MIIVFEIGSADWINIDRESGFVKNAHEATRFPDKYCAEVAMGMDERYSWLLDKDMLEFQRV